MTPARSDFAYVGSELDLFATEEKWLCLEHIEDDRGELARIARALRPGGHVVVMSPAHPFLFSAFDAAIGHHRRYARRTLTAAAPPALRLVRMEALHSVGMVASLMNRLVLRQSMPTREQLAVWDRG
jgi:hypothetical protein